MSPSEALGRLAVDLYESDSVEFGLSLARLLPKLGAHLEQAGRISDVRDVTARDVQAWVDAALVGGNRPSLATRHSRRAAARLGFRLLREAGIVDHDPTVDIRLPPRSRGREARPLTDDEIRRGRAASAERLAETRGPVVWALAEATATTQEIPRVLPEHVDLAAGTVLLRGSSRVEARRAPLTDWGVQSLERRLKAITTPDRALAYDGASLSPATLQSSAAKALVKTLTRAGLRSDPRVKPGSVRAWAGRSVFLTTGRIERVALALGCQTLDTAAVIIDFDWRDHQ